MSDCNKGDHQTAIALEAKPVETLTVIQGLRGYFQLSLCEHGGFSHLVFLQSLTG